MSWQQVVLLTLYAVNTVLAIAKIGKPREPITSGEAAYIFVINGLLAWMVTTIPVDS